MTLPASNNPIKFSQLNTELRRTSTAQINIGNTTVRIVASKPSGKISLSDLQGKRYYFSPTVPSGSTNVDLRSVALAQGWDGNLELVFENTGTIYSTSTSIPALTISGSFPNGVTVKNTGSIIGKGGAGGRGGGWWIAGNTGGDYGGAGEAGGIAIFVSTNVTINNTGTIGGGGGGGGGSAIIRYSTGFRTSTRATGGGGGGGAGYGFGGPGGQAGYSYPSASPGADGTATAAGAGGAGGVTYEPYYSPYYFSGLTGGAGGALGADGTAGAYGGYTNSYPGAAGAAGLAVSGNSYVTWASTGTILGART